MTSYNGTTPTTDTTGGSRLDDPHLLYNLVKQAKSSHSNLGRSLDVDLSYRKMGGATVEPGVLTVNRQEKERQLEAQRQLQGAWGTDKQLAVPHLATLPPSFTQAADDGVAVLGGTAKSAPGFTTLIAPVPTEATVHCIEDNMELISSFRPYQYDAQRATREAAGRDTAAPHPDLLQLLAPTLASVSPCMLVDVGSLPSHLLPKARQTPVPLGEEDGPPPPPEEREPAAPAAATKTKAAPGATDGTYSFRAVGRDRDRPALPGTRQPVVGQYQVRYAEVEPRVTHGYVAPPATTTSREALAATTAETSPARADSPAPTDDGASVYNASVYGGVVEDRAEGPPCRPGENVKGSSMFLSRTQRDAGQGTAAPDVSYWPYEDVRSTTKRDPCLVQMGVPVTTRRREPPVSGVPAGAYHVQGDIAKGMRNAVQMRSTTGRDAHWYGKREQLGDALDYLDLDPALRAVRPSDRAAVLPPRVGAEDASAAGRGAPPDTSVSVERNLDYPGPGIGGAEGLTRVRDFGDMVTREEREHARSLNAFATTSVEGYDVDRTATQPRAPAARIHPRAPGHGALHDPDPTELGEPPNLKWVRPTTERSTAFGVGSARPNQLLPLHDLSYDADRGRRALEPHTKGNPMIGSTVSREARARVAAKTEGNGPDVMYDVAGLPKQRARQVPDFEKQITKETQFAGHRVQSERWLAKNPKAPAPGHYNVSYSQVE